MIFLMVFSFFLLSIPGFFGLPNCLFCRLRRQEEKRGCEDTSRSGRRLAALLHHLLFRHDGKTKLPCRRYDGNCNVSRCPAMSMMASLREWPCDHCYIESIREGRSEHIP